MLNKLCHPQTGIRSSSWNFLVIITWKVSTRFARSFFLTHTGEPTSIADGRLSKELFRQAVKLLSALKSTQKLFNRTQRTTLTVFCHSISPSEAFGW